MSDNKVKDKETLEKYKRVGRFFEQGNLDKK
jgi:hypothetical protein